MHAGWFFDISSSIRRITGFREQARPVLCYHGGYMRATADQLLRSLIIVRLWNGRCAARNAHGVYSAHAAACTRRVPRPDRSKREKRWRAVDNRRWRKPSPLCSLYPSSRSSCSVHTATPQNRRKSSRVSFRLTNRVTANETSLLILFWLLLHSRLFVQWTKGETETRVTKISVFGGFNLLRIMKEYKFYYIETICLKETFRETGWLDRHNEETNGKFNGSLIVPIPL